jgi:starch synthase
MVDKIRFDEIEEAHVESLKTPNYSNLMKVAVDFSDGIIKGSQELPAELEDYLADCKKPVLDYQYPEAFTEAYTDFYTTKILK